MFANILLILLVLSILVVSWAGTKELGLFNTLLIQEVITGGIAISFVVIVMYTGKPLIDAIMVFFVTEIIFNAVLSFACCFTKLAFQYFSHTN